MNVSNNIISEDLDHIFNSTASMWNELRDKQLFLTGATGFFGTWLLESFIEANKKLDLNAKVVVLTRNLDAFQKQSPHICSNRAIRFHIGDVRNYEFPKGTFSHIIHGATTSATETFNNQDPLIKYDTIAEGTRHTLEFAVYCNCEKFLLTSSASAYGKQPLEISHISEDFSGAPYTIDKNFDHSVLGEAKRTSEILTTIYSDKYGIETKIARCYSFVGPYLPLNIHYAMGNFIRDALNGGPIKVLGDGTALRSYLYTSDLTTWLWTILFRGQSCDLYNVGSEEGITIYELAKLIAQTSNKEIDVIVKQSNKARISSDIYVPSTKKARTNLGIKQNTDLKLAIERTMLHIKANKSLYNLNI